VEITSTLPSPDEACQAAVRVRRLRVVLGTGAVEQRGVALTGDRVALGREPGPDTFVVAASEVSRVHAVLERDPVTDAWSIADAGSRNGTYVDGAAAGRVALRHGTVVRIGPVLLVCEDALVTSSDDGATSPLVGRSAALRRVRADCETVGPSLVPVLIEGETGTGKELVAAELHRASRRSGPFVPVNCGAIPGGLAESELFGHAVGAFTGAIARHDGLFAAARHGTLFLDEIGEMPADVQAKLLRALAVREVRPVGSSQAVKVDVRVIAATNRALDDEVASGRFRADLLARLAGWRLPVPPLRDRREDILVLAELFLGRENQRLRLTSHAAEALLLHPWPYNVRELEQVMAAAAVRAATGEVIRLEHLPAGFAALLGPRGAVR
jgi:transcriptional regulator with AAA-type ATPase domain